MDTEITTKQILTWIQEAGIAFEISDQDFMTPLSDLGVDSLDFFNILEILEEKSAISIPDDAVTQLNSIQDIADFISR